MTVQVAYECPYCGTPQYVERDAYLNDKSVTRRPLDGWEYTPPSPVADYDDADGIALVCAGDGLRTVAGCGETFYLSFLRYERGEEVDPRADRLAADGAGGIRRGSSGWRS